MKESINLFIFRRDLRIQDNLSLNKLLLNKIPILPIFIFNDKQILPKYNKYFSENCFEFMLESLEDLNNNIGNKLLYFKEDEEIILNNLLQYYDINTVGFNLDYTPFAKKRDDNLIKILKKLNLNYVTEEDYTLFPLNTIKTNNDTNFEVFTPYYKKVLLNINLISKENIKDFKWKKVNNEILNRTINIKSIWINNKFKELNGGRINAIKILNKIKNKEFLEYEKERDYPYLDKTTKLSAYIKFGCISIRELFWLIYNTYGINHGLIRELIWRNFYAEILNNNPRILNGEALKIKYNNLKWENNKEWIQSWSEGKTGFPFIDAGMRCLNKTGFMHNRLRMIVAMFFTKDMICDWKIGEQIFATKLIDYDPASNSGGWQWSSSVGADSQPYFRIFNPHLQSEKFDSECLFIKKWIPELKDISNKEIHNWYKYYHKYSNIYVKPILEHKIQINKIKKIFSQIH